MDEEHIPAPREESSGPVMLGDVEVHPHTNELVIDGETVRLKPKVMLLLRALIAADGGVITKADLLDSVWPNMDVSDSALTEAIHELRKALSDKARDPRYIQTIARRGYRVVAPIRPVGTSVSGSAGDARPRVALTRFRSLSSDPEDRYFCEGLCEELINSLGRSTRIDVVARTSILEAINDELTELEIATRLGATHIVNGTLRRHGNKIRVIAHLIDGETGVEVWSDAYDRELDEFIVVQSEIAAQIGESLTPHFGGTRERSSTYTPNPEAFLEFSKGRFFWKQDNTNPGRAMQHYERAMQIDPQFAEPCAGMVACFNTLGLFHLMPQQPAREASTRFAEKAMLLDPNSPETLFAFAYTQFYMRWDWESAESAFLKCLSINPNHVFGHAYLSLLYSALGNREQSRRHTDTAVRLDPYAPMIGLINFMHYHYFRDFDAALEAARQAVELNPLDPVVTWGLADSLVQLDRESEATRSIDRLVELTAEFPLYRACAGVLYAKLGRPDELARIRAELRQVADIAQDSFIEALMAVHLGEHDAAITALEQAERDHDAILWVLCCEPYFDPLRDNDRFLAILERMKLPTDHSLRSR